MALSKTPILRFELSHCGYQVLLLWLPFFLAACSVFSGPQGSQADTAVPETSGPPGVGSDAACQYLLNKSYRTPQNKVLGNTDQGSVLGPWVVSFLTDGRVVWKYSMEAVIGNFQCQEGILEAQFKEGMRPTFSGVFDLETGLLTLDGDIFLEITDE